MLMTIIMFLNTLKTDVFYKDYKNQLMKLKIIYCIFDSFNWRVILNLKQGMRLG